MVNVIDCRIKKRWLLWNALKRLAVFKSPVNKWYPVNEKEQDEVHKD